MTSFRSRFAITKIFSKLARGVLDAGKIAQTKEDRVARQQPRRLSLILELQAPTEGETMLNEEGVAQLIAEVIQDLELGNLREARRRWMNSDFERSMDSIPDPSLPSSLTPAAHYGEERVQETANRMQRCLRASDAEVALTLAKAAADRWAAGR